MAVAELVGSRISVTAPIGVSVGVVVGVIGGVSTAVLVAQS